MAETEKKFTVGKAPEAKAVEHYCTKCRVRRPLKDIKQKELLFKSWKKGKDMKRQQISGRCTTCSMTICKFAKGAPKKS